MPPRNDEQVPPLSPRQLLTGELPAVLSLWERTPTPETARALLALWAGLKRLELGAPDPDEERLSALVGSAAGHLVQLASNGPFFDAEGWLRRAEELDRAWDNGEEDPLELEWQTQELFEQLDRAALTLWAMEKLVGSDADSGHLAAVRQAFGRADTLLAERPDLFLCRATSMADVLSAARSGLEEREPGLWETLLRHRRVEEARDEVESAPGRKALLLAARNTPSPIRLIDPRGWVRRAAPRARRALAPLLCAACVLLAVLGWDDLRQRKENAGLRGNVTVVPARGWVKPSAFPQDLSARDYLARIADEAEEWSGGKAETAPELARWIAAFRTGCTELRWAEHRPLKEADRKWLIEQCLKWAETAQTTLIDLEEDKIDAASARAAMDRMVTDIVRSLRARANEVGGA